MIDSNHLSTLFTSTRRDAQGRLPQLVRRLIFASCANHEIPRFEMPGGDDVRLHGWDGTLSFNGSHPYIPAGDSVWEMGVSGDPESKANGDYEKRTKTPGNTNPSKTTFVFVTPHVWAGRNAWVEAKRAEGVWADVRAIDGSILATWLERAPAIAVWIADTLGRSIRGLHSIDRLWESSVSNQYSDSITPDLIIGGRQDARDKLLEFLQSPSGAVSVVGESAEEGLLFALAVCKRVFTPEQRSRLFVLSDTAAAEHLATLSEEHVAILTDQSIFLSIRSESLNHIHFVAPEKRDARANRTIASIELDSLRRSEVADALHRMGRPEEEADRLAAESKGSLQALLWMIARPERGALEWASGVAATELAPLVLAGQWVAADHPDHEVVAELAQRDYQEIKQTLAEWSGPGNPLARWGATWDWKAWEYAWTLLAPVLQREDIDRFLKIAEQVLGAADPALELPPDERWLANIRGKVHSYSLALREGLAHSLVLLAINGHLLRDMDGQAAVNHFVDSLLRVPDPATRWMSLARWLPDLAEAAPDAFLGALERFTANPDAVKELFAEGGMFGASPHTHVLWALERLAWSPDHLGQVVLALGRLAAVDPGGNLVNRPSRSLRMIMLPWHPATWASTANRMSGLRLLFKNVEPVAWQCAASLLPKPHDIGEPFGKPRWRDWARDAKEGVTLQDYWTFQEQLVAQLLEHTNGHGDRWAALLGAAPDLCKKHPELGKSVVAALQGIDPTQLEREDAFTLGEAARSLVMRHESMQHTDWAMKGELLETFQAIRDRLRPPLRRDQDRWLFAQWPETLRERGISMKEREENLSVTRGESVVAVIAQDGFGSVLEWSAEVGHPETLGFTLASAEVSREQEQQLLSLGLDSVGTQRDRPPLARTAFGYLAAKHQGSDEEWRRSTVAAVFGQSGPRAAAFVLQAFRYGQETWSLVSEQDKDVQSAYWNEVFLHFLTLEECEIALPKLAAANRPFAVIDLAAMLVHDVENKELGDEEHARIAAIARAALDATIDHLPRDEFGSGNTTSYEINQLLEYLESQGVLRADLAKWEWMWLPFISEDGRQLKALQAELADDPVLFVDLLKLVFRPSTPAESEEEVSEETEARARLAFQLLETWSRVPGLEADAKHHADDTLSDGLGPISPAWSGAVYGTALTAWIDRAIELATAADRLDICHQRIGRQLAFAPADENGVWPCIEVRDAIERLANDALEQGMILSVSNRRGVHFVGRDGAQESKLASCFREWCEQVRLEYPRTGAVLRRLAEQYEREAQSEIEQGRIDEFRS